MESLLSTALDSGLGAVALIALVYFVIRQQKSQEKERTEHKAERETWKSTSDKQFEKIAEIGEQQTKATAEYTGAVNSLRALIRGENYTPPPRKPDY